MEDPRSNSSVVISLVLSLELNSADGHERDELYDTRNFSVERRVLVI